MWIIGAGAAGRIRPYGEVVDPAEPARHTPDLRDDVPDAMPQGPPGGGPDSAEQGESEQGGPGARTVTVPTVLAAAVASDPARPRLTWYAADGERVELSARVLTNWVAKTANLLLEELLDEPVGDGRPPGSVRVDLPAHWRSVVWVLAAWSVGVEVGEVAAPVVVTDRPSITPAPGSGVPLVVVDLAPLAFEGGQVPAGALDYNAVVAGYGDEMPTGGVPLERQVEPPAGPGDASPPRVLLVVGGGRGEPAGQARDPEVAAVATAVLAVLSVDGSAVLAGPGSPDRDHLVDVERVTP